jgi:hypothetical protein
MILSAICHNTLETSRSKSVNVFSAGFPCDSRSIAITNSCRFDNIFYNILLISKSIGRVAGTTDGWLRTVHRPRYKKTGHKYNFFSVVSDRDPPFKVVYTSKELRIFE